MKIRSDGSIQPGSVPTPANIGRGDDNAVYRCMVTRVVYVDDSLNYTANSSNPRVLYDVVVLGGFASGQVISNCRLASLYGGNTAYWERTLRAASVDSKLSQSDGDIVFVQFVQGHTGFPVIIALDQGVSTSGLIGASKSQGPRSKSEFNGVNEEINNQGELTIQVKGGSANQEKGSFTPAGSPLATLKVSKDEKYTRIFRSGLSVTEDGKSDTVTITTAGGLTITYNGQTDEIKLITSAGAELKLSSGKVALGADGIEILDKLSSLADYVATWATSVGAIHTHIGNLGYPTAPPTQAAGYATLGTQAQGVKSDVDGIKGAL